MADFAAINTARLRVNYTVATVRHSMTVRGATKAAVTDPAFTSQFSAFLLALTPVLSSGFNILSTEAAEVNETFFTPSPSPVTLTSPGSGPVLDRASAPRFLSFIGRSAFGNQAKIIVYGPALAPEVSIENDYRVLASESTAIANAIAVLNGWSGLRAIDLSAVTWYPYANYALSAYYQRKVRRG